MPHELVRPWDIGQHESRTVEYKLHEAGVDDEGGGFQRRYLR